MDGQSGEKQAAAHRGRPGAGRVGRLTNPWRALASVYWVMGTAPSLGGERLIHKVRCTEYPLGVYGQNFSFWSSLYPMGADQGMLRQSVFRVQGAEPPATSLVNILSLDWFGIDSSHADDFFTKQHLCFLNNL